jgi:hypothetical protein
MWERGFPPLGCARPCGSLRPRARRLTTLRWKTVHNTAEEHHDGCEYESRTGEGAGLPSNRAAPARYGRSAVMACDIPLGRGGGRMAECPSHGDAQDCQVAWRGRRRPSRVRTSDRHRDRRRRPKGGFVPSAYSAANPSVGVATSRVCKSAKRNALTKALPQILGEDELA